MTSDLIQLKQILESFPEGSDKVRTLNWGNLVKQIDARGVLSVDGGIFFYTVDDRFQSLFIGPMTLQEAVGYIGTAKLALDVGEYDLSFSQLREICVRMHYSYENGHIL